MSTTELHHEVFQESANILDISNISHDIYGSMAMAEMVTRAGFVDSAAR